MAALHRIYLNPSGNIYPVLADIISPKAYDLTNLLRGRTNERETQVMIQELQYVVENLIYHMTEIMPSTGVLGTHRKSAVYELIRDGKRFPDGYFWQVELDRLQFTENGRTTGIGDPEAFLLIVGIFISRSMITTLLMKPVDYGLSSSQLTDVAERNLKILATTLLYLVRRVSGSRGRAMMEMPSEIAKYLYTDEEMRPVFSKWQDHSIIVRVCSENGVRNTQTDYGLLRHQSNGQKPNTYYLSNFVIILKLKKLFRCIRYKAIISIA